MSLGPVVPWAIPARVILYSGGSAPNVSVAPCTGNQRFCVTEFDGVVNASSATDAFMEMSINGAVVYHKDQAIGTGTGLWWQWQGMHCLTAGDTILVGGAIIGGSASWWSATVSGFYVPAEVRPP